MKPESFHHPGIVLEISDELFGVPHHSYGFTCNMMMTFFPTKRGFYRSISYTMLAS